MSGLHLPFISPSSPVLGCFISPSSPFQSCFISPSSPLPLSPPYYVRGFWGALGARPNALKDTHQ
ncbi:hypothetical protein C8J27_103184 [Rhodobacter aestuarii]|uniref:Uncharacterized protein n=1 Tax=Rhodobacter aestuarii TaxID=453582 RepID=A0A1N7K540_9RHOB|nr:hypothetical protein C8J27_103184 [Rhodobacter aestuarii]SIS56670.1 hypothetical protein SAMN05421580_102250 [Rhodobacter aestuarii]